MAGDELDALRQLAEHESPAVMAYLLELRDTEVAALEGKADRNWSAIQRFSRRTTVLLVVLTLVLLGLGAFNLNVSSQLSADEQHGITVQKQGVPITVCLIEVFRNVAPLLERAPAVQRPLRAYLTLQGGRYAGKRCPEKPGEAAALAKTLAAP